MKKKFKDTKTAKFFKSKAVKGIGQFLFGAFIDPLKIVGSPIVGAAIGAVTGLKNSKKENKESELGGKGNTNYPRLVGLIFFAFLVVAYLVGWIDQNTFEIIFNRLIELRG